MGPQFEGAGLRMRWIQFFDAASYATALFLIVATGHAIGVKLLHQFGKVR